MMVTTPTRAAEGPTIANAMEAAWFADSAAIASQVAAVQSIGKALAPAELMKLYGPDLVAQAQQLIAQYKRVGTAARMLDRREAVLLAWHDQDRDGAATSANHLAVVRADAVAAMPGAQLGLWPIVVGVGIVAVSAGAVIIQYWEVEQTQLREANRALEIAARARMIEQAAPLAQSDPQLWGKLQVAAQQATAAGAAAAKDPAGFFDRMVGAAGAGMGAGMGFGLPPLLILGALWAWANSNGGREKNRRRRRRRAA